MWEGGLYTYVCGGGGGAAYICMWGGGGGAAYIWSSVYEIWVCECFSFVEINLFQGLCFFFFWGGGGGNCPILYADVLIAE